MLCAYDRFEWRIMNTKVTLDFAEISMRGIDSIVKRTSLKSREDLFYNALALLKWTVKETRAGRTVASIDLKTNRFKELHMPCLKAVSSNS